jgi:hypothetical protein
MPEDVTAMSADQWWVLGDDTAGCTGAACTRILVTVDGGQTFASIPTPPTAVTGLRFRDPEDGWAYSSTTVWATHDGGARWSATTFPGMTVEDLETSGSYVYAVACTSTPVCWLERSPTTTDSWQALAIPSDVVASGYLAGSLNVHDSSVWMAFRSDEDNGNEQVSKVLTSTDDGDHFSETSVCPGSLGINSLYAGSSEDLWATCSTGLLVGVWQSEDGGSTFTAVPETGGFDEPMSGTIAGNSASQVVLAGTSLLVSADGGQTYQVAFAPGGNWRIVGFTTSEDGFALSLVGPTTGLWRTVDAGAHWYQVQLP